MNGWLLVAFAYTLIWSARPCYCIQDTSEKDLQNFSYQVQSGIRSQRDLMDNVTIDQVPLIGVNIFDSFLKHGKNDDTRTLINFMELMHYGVQSFTVDLEARRNEWMLKESNISFGKFLNVFHNYVNSSDNNLSANMLVLLLRISPSNSSSNSTSMGQDGNNITDILDKNLGRQRIYTPDDLEFDRENGQTYSTSGDNSVGWPILGSFLYHKRRRVVLMEITKSLVHQNTPYIFNGSSILHLDKGNATLEAPKTVAKIRSLAAIGWRFLESSFTPPDIKQYTDMGYNPIITNEYSAQNFSDIYPLLNATILWSWRPNQPKSASTNETTHGQQLVAYNCAALHYTPSNFSASWEVENCYAKHKGLCKHQSERYVWVTSKNHDTSFKFDGLNSRKCPDNYHFSLPKTPLEQLAVTQYLRNISSEDAYFWIDLNSIYVNDCWVIGGPDASCPYQRVVSKRNFVSMFTPITVCSLVILCIMLYLNLLRVPIHNNRKSWRRIVNEVSKSDVDGVPS